MQPSSPATEAPALPRATRLTWFSMVAVAAVVILVTGGRMLFEHAAHDAATLLEPPELTAARETLLVEPKNEAIKEKIRIDDLKLRERYFLHLDRNALGAWLLLGGGVILILAGRGWAAALRRPPRPLMAVLRPDAPLQRASRARLAVATTALVAALGLWIAAHSVSSSLPDSPEAVQALLAAEPEIAPTDPGPSPEEWLANWPLFRGPRGDGVALTTNAPLHWDAETGEGMLWRAPVPHVGHSSPIVWGDRVFLTGGSAESRHVLCYDATNGNLLWDQIAPPPPQGFPEPLEVMEDTGFAASTAATDGRRVYAIFATGELAAFDFSGKVVWSKTLGVPESMYGYASSLVVWHDLLLVLYDQGDGTDGKSRLYAFEGATGELRWEQRRPVGASWSTPLIVESGGQAQIMTQGEPWVISYDATSGKELWRVDCMGTDLAPMPVTVNDLLVVVSPGNHVSGLRMDGRDDVTATHQVWQYDEFIPDITSPLSDGEHLYLLITYGDLVCMDATRGETIYEKELELEFNASPTLVGRNIYAVSTDGVTVVFAAGPEYRELARSALNEPVRASPAFVRNRMFVRGTEHLFCLGDTPPPPATQP